MQYQTLIVGAHFRPPAKQLLAVLPPGHRLQLIEDNENAYDAAAVKVVLELVDPVGLKPLLTEAQMAELEQELPNVGMTLEQVMSTGPVQLGFIPAQDGKPLAKARQSEPDLLGNVQVREIMGNGEVGAARYFPTLAFGLDGAPRLAIDVTE